MAYLYQDENKLGELKQEIKELIDRNEDEILINSYRVIAYFQLKKLVKRVNNVDLEESGEITYKTYHYTFNNKKIVSWEFIPRINKEENEEI